MWRPISATPRARPVLVALAICAVVALASGIPGLPPTPAVALGTNSITSPDTGGDVGLWTSIALDSSGYPVISYNSDTPDYDLDVMHCNDPDCDPSVNGPETITSPDTIGIVGIHTSIALDGSGYPVVSYYAGAPYDDLRVLHCNDPNCAGDDESITSPDTGGVGAYTSLALDASDYPVVSYFDGTNGDLKVMHCNDADCSGSDESITSPDTGGLTVGLWTSLALDASGYPVVSYLDSSNGHLRVMHCNDPNCAGDDESITSPDTVGSVGAYTSLVLDGSGNPVVSYYAGAPYDDLRVLHCNDANCAGDNESITSPDTAGQVGHYTSLALDGTGNPVVGYLDVTNYDLKVLHCNDANCSGSGESITSVDTGGAVGQFTSLVLDGSGNAVVSYHDATNDDLKVLHCNDADCSGADESVTTPDDGGDVGLYTSLVLDGSGNPVASYYDDATGDLRVLHCNDPNCSGGDESIVTADPQGDVGKENSLVLDSSGNPVVSYHDQSNGDLKVMHCNDPNCAGGDESIEPPDTGGNVGACTSLALDSSGYPVVSYTDVTNFDLKVMHCDDPNCADGGESIQSPDTTAHVGTYTSLELDGSGYPVISYYDDSNGNLKVMHCNDPDCAGGGESIESPDTDGDQGRFSSLVLDASGYPVVSYRDWNNGDLRVLHCNDPNCSGGDESAESPDTVSDVGYHTSVALDGSGNPVVSYYDYASQDLKVMHCNDPNCAGGDESLTLPDTDGSVGAYTSLALDGSGHPVVSYQDATNRDLKVLHCGDANCTVPLTFTVDSAGDGGDSDPGDDSCDDGSGNCTLRAAIEEANATKASDNIKFNIPGAGPHTIRPDSALPIITDPVVIDGYTQPGATPNTNPPAMGSNAVLKIELDGTNAGVGDGLWIWAGNTTVRGLAINRFQANGVRMDVDGGNTIAGNFIGTDVTGITIAGTQSGGVYIFDVAGNTIGGSSSGDRNVISGSQNNGVYIRGEGATSNRVLGNLIGTDLTGTVDLGNSRFGVTLTAVGNTVGGTTPEERNVISGNDWGGVYFDSPLEGGNQVLGNYIGVDVTGTVELPNSGYGVNILASPDNVIGGTTAGARNVISGNEGPGVSIRWNASGTATRNHVQGNYIGVDATGTVPLPNSDGVWINRAPLNAIGGGTSAARNVISGNDSMGVRIEGIESVGNQVLGNYIGTNPAGDAAMPNGDHGIFMYGSSTDSIIGGTNTGEGNLVAHNWGDGVRVEDATTTGNSIRGNSIHSNGALGIDLVGDGVTANDTGDGDSGPNNLQNFPNVSSAVVGSLTVQGMFNSMPDTTFNLDFYASTTCDASGSGEGETYIGSTAVTTNGSGDAPFSVVLAADVPAGDLITGTATDPNGNTSEFSACIEAEGAPAAVLAGEPDNPGFSGDQGEAQNAQVDGPHGLYETAGDVLYFADTGNDRVRTIDPNLPTGTIDTVAGGGNIPCTGQTNDVGDGCAPTDAILSGPRDVFVDSTGDLYIADTEHCRVRKVSGGVITTIAGDGTCAFGGDGGAATDAKLNRPSGVFVDGSGDLYIADTENCRVRKVSGGNISTVAGTGACGFLGDNWAATDARLNRPHDVYFLGEDLLMADTDNHRIRRVDLSSGVITTLAGTGTAGLGGDGRNAVDAKLNGPEAISVGESRVFVADTGNDRIRRVNALTGIITTVVGEGGMTVPVALDKPAGVAVGSLTIANTNDHTLIAAGVDPRGDRSHGFVPVRSCEILPGISSIDWALPAVLLGLLLVRKRLGALFIRLQSAAALLFRRGLSATR